MVHHASLQQHATTTSTSTSSLFIMHAWLSTAQAPGAVCKNCNKWFAKGIVISALEPPPESLRPQCPAVWISSKAKRRKLGSALKRSSKKTNTEDSRLAEQKHGTTWNNSQKPSKTPGVWDIMIYLDDVWKSYHQLEMHLEMNRH